MLDPEISEFVRAVTEIYSRVPPRDQLTVAEARVVAEQARRRWADGGPDMLRTDETFAEVGGRSVRLRIHRPLLEASPAPALIYLHGGGWTLFSIDTHDRLMREYAARSGLVVVGVDYSLSPEACFPEPVHEIAGVVEWLIDHAAGLGLDASRFVIGGDSAGGNLAVATALTLRNVGRPEALSGMVLNYGVFDATFDRPSYLRYGNGEFLLSRRDMVWFWGNYVPSESDRANPLASVLRADLAGLPRTFMVITECDVLFDENVEMADRLREAGVTVETTVYPGTVHSFLEAISIADVSARAFADTSAWLKRLCFDTRNPDRSAAA